MSTCGLHPEIERPCWECGIARVRAAIPARPAHRAPDPDPARDRAIARARNDRTTAKESKS